MGEGRYEDALSLEAIEHYFRLYYWEQSTRWDAKGILAEFHLNQDRRLPFLFGFARAADRFQVIDDLSWPLVIPWGREGAALCQNLRSSGLPPDPTLLRRLQRYTVQIPQWLWNQHAGTAIELVHNRYPMLVSPELHYSERIGLCLERGLTECLIT